MYKSTRDVEAARNRAVSTYGNYTVYHRRHRQADMEAAVAASKARFTDSPRSKRIALQAATAALDQCTSFRDPEMRSLREADDAFRAAEGPYKQAAFEDATAAGEV